MMQNSITGIEQNCSENHRKEQTAAGEIVAQVIVQPLLLRRGRFTEDKKKVKSVESAGKIWIRSERNGCIECENGSVCGSDGDRGRICDGLGNVVGEKAEVNIVKSGAVMDVPGE